MGNAHIAPGYKKDYFLDYNAKRIAAAMLSVETCERALPGSTMARRLDARRTELEDIKRESAVAKQMPDDTRVAQALAKLRVEAARRDAARAEDEDDAEDNLPGRLMALRSDLEKEVETQLLTQRGKQKKQKKVTKKSRSIAVWWGLREAYGGDGWEGWPEQEIVDVMDSWVSDPEVSACTAREDIDELLDQSFDPRQMRDKR